MTGTLRTAYLAVFGPIVVGIALCIAGYPAPGIVIGFAPTYFMSGHRFGEADLQADRRLAAWRRERARCRLRRIANLG